MATVANPNSATPLQRLAAQQNWDRMRIKGAIATLMVMQPKLSPYLASLLGSACVELRIADRQLPAYHERQREDLRDQIREGNGDDHE